MLCPHGIEVGYQRGPASSPCEVCNAQRFHQPVHAGTETYGQALCPAKPGFGQPLHLVRGALLKFITCPACIALSSPIDQPIPQEKTMEPTPQSNGSTALATEPQLMPPPPIPAAGPRSLVRKLAEVMGEIHRVAKNGRNEFHKYDYATEADIAAAVREGMAQRALMLISDVRQTKWREVPGKNGPQQICTLTVHFAVHDGDTGEVMEFTGLGEGQDSGDKATYKALTGAVKYALLKLFLIPTGHDPEDDEPQKPARGKAQKPANEPAPQQQAATAKLPAVNDAQASTNKLLERLVKVASLEELDKLMAWAKSDERPTKVYGEFWAKVVLPAELAQREKLKPLPPEQERAKLAEIKASAPAPQPAPSAFDTFMADFDKAEKERSVPLMKTLAVAIKREHAAGNLTNEDHAQLLSRGAVVKAKIEAPV